ncbi:MAG: ribonuclease E/G, partial [Brevundimonas sp.]
LLATAAEVGLQVAADDEVDDGEAGRRRRRGRRGGRRMREDGERDAFTWVRGRTPSLDDPYVWFDPINPAPRSERAPAEASEAGDVVESTAERPEGERAEREGGRSRRRRGRGRGRDRSGLAHEAKVEDRAVNEGLPPVGSQEAVADAPEVVAESVEAPKRRRVRRKVSADVAGEAVIEAPAESEVTVEAAVEAEPVAVPAQLDVEPAVAAKIEAAIEQALEPEAVAEPAIVVEPTPEPTPEVDVAAIIAEDPNQIVAPPAKPKRGWWRR